MRAYIVVLIQLVNWTLSGVSRTLTRYSWDLVNHAYQQQYSSVLLFSPSSIILQCKTVSQTPINHVHNLQQAVLHEIIQLNQSCLGD
jgi:hypothetical protein